MNFPESSLANLGSLGYTEDEARFLYLVATHSGYFSMRQFLQFTRTKSGDKSMTFSQKLLAKGHATARSFLRNGLVYHLFSRIELRSQAQSSWQLDLHPTRREIVEESSKIVPLGAPVLESKGFNQSELHPDRLGNTRRSSMS